VPHTTGKKHDVYYPSMGVVSACAFSFMSKYLHQSCCPKPMTRVDINDNNQSSNMLFENKSLIPIGSGSIIITSHHQYLHSLLSPMLTVKVELYINEGSGCSTRFSINIVMIVINTHICKHLLSLIFVIFGNFSSEMV
jgi:hypothetical protein